MKDKKIERNKNFILTDEKIINAYYTLLIDKNKVDVGVSEICKEAGINRTTFYTHYKGLYEVVERLEDRFVAFIFELKELMQFDFRDFVHNPEKMFTILNEKIKKNEKYFRFMINPERIYYVVGKIAKVLFNYVVKSFPNIEKNPSKKETTYIHVLYFVSSVASLYVQRLNNIIKIPFENITKTICGIVNNVSSTLDTELRKL